MHTCAHTHTHTHAGTQPELQGHRQSISSPNLRNSNALMEEPKAAGATVLPGVSNKYLVASLGNPRD